MTSLNYLGVAKKFKAECMVAWKCPAWQVDKLQISQESPQLLMRSGDVRHGFNTFVQLIYLCWWADFMITTQTSVHYYYLGIPVTQRLLLSVFHHLLFFNNIFSETQFDTNTIRRPTCCTGFTAGKVSVLCWVGEIPRRTRNGICCTLRAVGTHWTLSSSGIILWVGAGCTKLTIVASST